MEIYSTTNFLAFHCTLDAHCCKNWEIFFTKEMIRKILDAGYNTFPQLSNIENFYQIVHPDNSVYYARIKLIDGKCIFLDDHDNLCAIFKTFGKNQGNPLCLTFPFMVLKLKEKEVITNFWSCISEINNLFNNLPVKIENITNINPSKNLSVKLDFSYLDLLCFSPSLTLEWDTFYYLEELLINFALSEKYTIWKILYILCLLNKNFSQFDGKLINTEHIKNILNLVDNNEIVFSNSAQTIFYFIKRKINLYHNEIFINQTKSILELDLNDIFKNDRNTFQNELSKWDNVFKKYFIIRFFSNSLNFTHSIQFFWHVLLFNFNFIKLKVFTIWKQNHIITDKDISDSIKLLERNFTHDSHIFEYLGKKYSDEGKFDEDSLLKLLV